jgi:hypothetical protein
LLADVHRHAPHIREFVPDLTTLRPVSVPWPVVWLLTRYNRNQLLCTDAMPRMDAFLRDLVQFGHKVR